MERRVTDRGFAAEAPEHLQDHAIVTNPDRLAQDLRWYVTVTEMPGDTDEMHRVPAPNVDNALGLRLHQHRAAVAECKSIAIGQAGGPGQIQQEFTSRKRSHRDAAPMPLVIVELDDFGIGRRVVDDGICDGPIHCQYRKYRCASGSSDAGSQVSNSPSARTS